MSPGRLAHSCSVIGVTGTAAVVAPPESNVPLIVGAFTFGCAAIAAVAAFSARETFRIPLEDLGEPDAAPLSREDYSRLRAEAIAA